MWYNVDVILILEGCAVYKLAICDDDTVCSASIKSFLYDFFSDRNIECSVTVYSDVQSFDNALDAGAEYDLVFLDIIFKDGNGMNYAKQLGVRRRGFDIIFISTSRDYAIESYDTEPLYYILKPAQPEKLTAALNRFLEKHASFHISFNTARGIIKIDLSDILYFEIYGHQIIVYKKDGVKEDFRGSLKEIGTQLPPSMFIRPHRSYIVNLNCITEITHYSIKLTNGDVIPVSHALYNKIQMEFLDYLDKKDIM